MSEIAADVLAILEGADPSETPEAPSQKAPPAEPAPAAGEPPAPAAGEPSDPPPDESFSRAFRKLNEERAQLDTQRAEIKAERESLAAFAGAKEAFRADPLGHLRSMVGAALGTEDVDEIKAFIEGEIYTGLTVDILGVDSDKLPEQLRHRSEYARLERQLAAEKAAREKQAAEMEAKVQKAAEDQRIEQARGVVSNWLGENKGAYPYLAVQDNVALDEVFGVLVKHAESPEMTLEKAAALVNEFYAKQAARYQSVKNSGTRESVPAAITNASHGQRAKPTGLTNSGASQAVTGRTEEPDLSDNEVSKEYWASLLEKGDPSLLK